MITYSMTNFEIYIIILINIALWVCVVFYKSYWIESGKNLATKKDIEEITSKVENVKSEIEILTHRKKTIQSEVQNAMLEFNNTHSAWLHNIANMRMAPNNDDDNIAMDNFSHELHMNCIIAKAKLDVYCYNDAELIGKGDKLIESTIELQNLVSSTRNKIAGIQSLMNIIEKHPEQHRIVEELKSKYEEIHKTLVEGNTEKLEMYRPIATQKWQYTGIINSRITAHK